MTTDAAAGDWISVHETLPPEGVHVDVWLQIHASPRSFGKGDSFRVPDAYLKKGKWFHRLESGKEAELFTDYVTHWMPEPSPPVSVEPQENVEAK